MCIIVVCGGGSGGCLQRPGALDPLGLELEAVMSSLMQVLKIKPGSFGRAASALNY